MTYKKSDPTDNLALNGADEDEIAFLCDKTYNWGGYKGQRVELNAFTSGDFIEWIESKLQEHGIKKVVPDAGTLETAYRRALQIAMVQQRLPKVIAETSKEAQAAEIPNDLDKIVRKRFRATPAEPWDDVIAATARTNCKERDGDGPDRKQAKSSSAGARDLTSCKKRAADEPSSKQAKRRSVARANLTNRQTHDASEGSGDA